jgi:hypothetical protein
VLVACGIVDEEIYVIALARWLGWDYESFENCYRESCPLDDRQMVEAAKTGLLPLIVDNEPVLVVAPRSVRQLLEYAGRHPRLRFRLASSIRLNAFVADFAAPALGAHASDSLLLRRPDLSAGASDPRSRIILAVIVAFVLGALATFPGPTVAVIEATLAGCFLAWLALRLGGCFVPPKAKQTATVSEQALPVYTVIVPLYGESETAAALVASLQELDYPGIR